MADALRQSWLLAGLLFVDAIVIGAHVAIVAFGIGEKLDNEWLFRIDAENCYPERYEVLKLLAAAAILVMIDVIERRFLFSGLAFAFAYLAFDNATTMHETAGVLLTPHAPAVGEMLYMAVVGTLLLSVLGYAWLNAQDRERPIVAAFGVALLVFGAFSVGVDALHAMAGSLTVGADLLFVLLEDGGEMVTISGFLAIAVIAFARLAAPRMQTMIRSLNEAWVG